VGRHQTSSKANVRANEASDEDSPLPPVGRFLGGLMRSFVTRARFHFTLAVTDAAPVSVNVQVFVLLPPLEQAPDQIASRPFETLSLIDVPVARVVQQASPVSTETRDEDAVLRA
jgi:hypothetical protein